MDWFKVRVYVDEVAKAEIDTVQTPLLELATMLKLVVDTGALFKVTELFEGAVHVPEVYVKMETERTVEAPCAKLTIKLPENEKVPVIPMGFEVLETLSSSSVAPEPTVRVFPIRRELEVEVGTVQDSSTVS